MNKKDVNWNDLQLFIAVARTGGLSAASRVTGKSPATLGRRMLSLEHDLGAELFARHDKGYELLSAGRILLEALQSVEASLDKLVTPASQSHCPLIKISAGTWTTMHLLAHIDTLSGSPQDCLIRFVTSEKVLDISHREVVIGFRNQRPMEDNLVCRKLGRVEFAPFGTKDAPQRWIKVVAETPSAKWIAKHSAAEVFVEVSSPRNSLDLALAGRGVALLPTFIGDTEETLTRQGSIIEELSHDQWLVTHHEDRYLPEVRRLIKRLNEVIDS